MNISFPSDTKDVIDAIRGAIGRDVYFYTDTPTQCSGCSLDPITNTSTDPYCIICDGLHWIPSYTEVSISGHITWGPSEVMGWVTGGQYIEGDCRVQIEYTSGNLNTLDNTEYVMVDDKRFTIRKRMYRGVPSLNRILIDLSEEEV